MTICQLDRDDLFAFVLLDIGLSISNYFFIKNINEKILQKMAKINEMAGISVKQEILFSPIEIFSVIRKKNSGHVYVCFIFRMFDL